MSDSEGQCKVVPGSRREWGLVVDGCGVLAHVLEVDGVEDHRIHSVRCHGLWGQGLGTGFVVGKVEDDAYATRV